MVTLTIDTSGISDGQTADAADVTTPFSDVVTHLNNILNGAQQFDQLRLNTATELTLDTGEITVTKSYHQVDTQSDAPSDDLDTISGGAAGDVLYITSAADARTVTVRHNVGNILTWDGNSISLDNTRKCLELLFDGTNWRAVSIIGSNTGADTALSNLAAVAINTSLISDTDSTDNLGSTSKYWANAYIDLLTVTEQATPTAPATGKGQFYFKTDGKPYAQNDGSTEYDLSATGGATSIAILTDEKTTGTDGGTSSSTTWNARDLNTEQSDPDGIVSISSNQFTPASGTYRMTAYAPAGQSSAGEHRIRLYNVTGTAVVQEGNSVGSLGTANIRINAFLNCRFTANGTDAYRIDHYTKTGAATTGLGSAVDDGSPEIYLVIVLEQE